MLRAGESLFFGGIQLDTSVNVYHGRNSIPQVSVLVTSRRTHPRGPRDGSFLFLSGPKRQDCGPCLSQKGGDLSRMRQLT